MQEAFATVLFVVVILAVVIAGITLATSGAAYKEIGKNGLFGDDDAGLPGRAGGGGGAAPVSAAVRDEEIRQMLQARSDRLVRRGKAPLDIDAELAALTRTQVNADPALVAEVRELVESRNRRRIRQGKEPLDVDAEIARQLSDFA